MQNNENKELLLKDINLEKILRKNVPELFELLGNRNLSVRQWNDINEKYVSVNNKRYEKYVENGMQPIQVQASFFDVIHKGFQGGNYGYYVFDDLIRKTLRGLSTLLSERNKDQFKTNLYNILIHHDHNYRNFIGELLLLENFLSQKKYRLERFEYPITDTTQADFHFIELATNESLLVEVVNINFLDKIPVDIIRFITGKLEAKYRSKTKGAEHMAFTLVPIVWADHSTLRRIEKAFDEGKGFNLPYAYAPCAFATYDYDNIKFLNQFGKITTMFKNISIPN